MGAEQKTMISLFWSLALMMAFCWSVSDSLKVFWATNRHPLVAKSSLELVEPARTEFKRSEQKYFLNYGIYVPLEDIMYAEQLPNGGARYAEALRRSCSGMQVGSGLAIWLPLKVVLPLLGERVIEWCWKVPVQR